MFAIIVEALESWYLLDKLKRYHVIEENQCLAIREYVSQIAKHIDRIEIEDGVYHTSDGLHRAVHIIHILLKQCNKAYCPYIEIRLEATPG